METGRQQFCSMMSCSRPGWMNDTCVKIKGVLPHASFSDVLFEKVREMLDRRQAVAHSNRSTR